MKTLVVLFVLFFNGKWTHETLLNQDSSEYISDRIAEQTFTDMDEEILLTGEAEEVLNIMYDNRINSQSSTDTTESGIPMEDYQKKNEEKHLRVKIVELFLKAETWHSVSDGLLDVLIGYPILKKDPVELLKREVHKLKKMTNSILNDVSCTYAYYAKTHLSYIHTIVDNKLIYCEFVEVLISKMKRVYLDTAMQTLATFYNTDHYAPEWMKSFVLYLQQTEHDYDLFYNNLSRMMETLTKATTIDSCDPKNVPQIVSKMHRNEIMEETFEKHPCLILHDNNSECQKSNNINHWTLLGSDILDSEDVAVQFENWLKDDKKPNPRYNDENMKTYILHTSKDIVLNLNNNLSDIQYILHKNKSILPYYDYKELNYPTPNVDDDLNEKTKLHFGQYAGLQNESAKSKTTDYFDKEKEKKILLENEVRAMMSVKTMHFTNHNKIDVLNKYHLNEQLNPKGFIRHEFAKSQNIMNTIMNGVECTYAHYANEHLSLATTVILKYKKNKGLKKIIFPMISKYFEVSLMTIATIINKHYKVSDWMLNMIIYLKHINELFDENFDLFTEDYLKLLDVLAYKTKDDCKLDVTRDLVPFIPMERFNWEPEDTTERNYYSFKIFQLKGLCLKLSSKPSTFKKYISLMNYNLSQIYYLLHLNEDVLPYDNFMQFHPSNWLITKDKLNLENINSLRWDVMVTRKKDENWPLVANQLLNDVNKIVYEDTNGINTVKNYIWIYKSVFNLLQATMIRYALSFLYHCNNVWWFIKSVEEFEENVVILEYYRQLCTGMSEPLEDLISWAGLENYRVLKNLPKKLNDIKNGNHDFSSTYKLWLKRLNKCSIRMNINSNIPVSPVWNSLTMHIYQWRSNLNKNILEDVFPWIVELKQGAIKFVSNVKNQFKNINFRFIHLILRSIENDFVHKSYIE